MNCPSTDRADRLMLTQGLCESRAQAQQLIEAGLVRADGKPLDKASRKLPSKTVLTLDGKLPYVSRAGEKLAHALNHFQIDPAAVNALDVGASTGGFTDCLLQHSAAHVTCVDVGHKQLHRSLRKHPRVQNFEGLHARDLREADLPLACYDLIVADLSFISLTLVLEAIWDRLAREGVLICLIKPQFELTPDALNRQGIVRNDDLRKSARTRVMDFATESLAECTSLGWTDSPIIGGDGNHEYLAAWRKDVQA